MFIYSCHSLCEHSLSEVIALALCVVLYKKRRQYDKVKHSKNLLCEQNIMGIFIYLYLSDIVECIPIQQ